MNKNKLLASIQGVAKSSAQIGDKHLFAKDDLPLDVRMAENCLFQMKRMLTAWGYNKSCVRVDTEASPKKLSVAGKDIVKATVEDHNLVLKWSDGEWETWEALQASDEFGAIKKQVQEKLDTAKGCGLSKGKGKASE